MRRLPDSAIAGVTLVALFCGAWLLHSGTASHAPPQPSAAQAHLRSGTPGVPPEPGGASGTPAALPLPPSPPDRIR
ncbi:class F sortase, partial [Streptomyces scabiei]|nr:class F sortase [Streptomyces scabiei]